MLPTTAELLQQHDADFLIALGGDENFFAIDQLRAIPTFTSIPAVEAERWSEAMGEMWTSSDPFAIYWVLQDMAALTANPDTPVFGSMDDLSERWAGYLALGEQRDHRCASRKLAGVGSASATRSNGYRIRHICLVEGLVGDSVKNTMAAPSLEKGIGYSASDGGSRTPSMMCTGHCPPRDPQAE